MAPAFRLPSAECSKGKVARSRFSAESDLGLARERADPHAVDPRTRGRQDVDLETRETHGFARGRDPSELLDQQTRDAVRLDHRHWPAEGVLETEEREAPGAGETAVVRPDPARLGLGELVLHRSEQRLDHELERDKPDLVVETVEDDREMRSPLAERPDQLRGRGFLVDARKLAQIGVEV